MYQKGVFISERSRFAGTGEMFSFIWRKHIRNFFRDPKVGFPRFKSKHHSKNSYTTNVVNGNILVEDNRIRLPKLKWISMQKTQGACRKLPFEISDSQYGAIRKVFCKSAV